MRRISVEQFVHGEGSRYEELLANAPIGIYRVSRSGQLLDGNPALARMLGSLSLEDLLSEGASNPFGTRGRARFWLRLEKQGEVNGYESEWPCAGGKKVFLREHARVVQGPDRQTLYFEGTLEDISDRQMAEAQLRAERDFSSAVIDTAGTLIVILDREGRIVRFNRACELVSGYSLHDVAGRHLWSVLEAVEADSARDSFDKVTHGDFPRTFENRWKTREGEFRDIVWSDSPILDGNGDIRFVICTGIDVTERKIAEVALRDNEARYRELFESASDIVFRVSLDGTFLSLNQAFERITGYRAPENVADVLEPEELAFSRQLVRSMLNGLHVAHYEQRVRKVDGGYVYLDLSTTLSREAGRQPEILGIGRDISWRKQHEQFERGRRRILEMATEHKPLPLVMRRVAELLTAQFPKALCRVDANYPSQPGTKPPVVLSSDPVYELLEATDPKYLSGYRMKWQLPLLSGESRDLGSISLFLERSEPPTPQESDILVTAVRLATLTIENRLLTDGIQWDAQHDKLTGLANRPLFEQILTQAIERAAAAGERVAIFFVDLDRFKLINDTLGHPVGDLLLLAVAQRLSRTVESRGSVARMGGDEFMVMVTSAGDRDKVNGVARELLTCFETPFTFSRNGQDQATHEMFISASIGGSIYPDDGRDVETLRRLADTAMYRAKGSGRNRFLPFSPAMTSGLTRRLNIQNELHRALDRNELRLFYQPQYDLKCDRIIGAEALLRWASQDLGPIGPGEFIPVAEESGLIVPIGTWVLQEACRQGQIWRELGLPLKLAVNVSALQFARPDFVNIVADALERNGIPASFLELELTESVVMQDPDEVRSSLSRLREMGVLVAIDDFGTGYSSLSYLQSLPIQSLKIDLSFVRSIPKSEEVPPLIRAITALAHGLNIDVLAEGVEEPYQARVLRVAGCDRVQGYLYGRPVPAIEIQKLLASGLRPSEIGSGAIPAANAGGTR